MNTLYLATALAAFTFAAAWRIELSNRRRTKARYRAMRKRASLGIDLLLVARRELEADKELLQRVGAEVEALNVVLAITASALRSAEWQLANVARRDVALRTAGRVEVN